LNYTRICPGVPINLPATGSHTPDTPGLSIQSKK